MQHPTRPRCCGRRCQGDRAAPGPVRCSQSRQGTRGCWIPAPWASSTRLHMPQLDCLKLSDRGECQQGTVTDSAATLMQAHKQSTSALHNIKAAGSRARREAPPEPARVRVRHSLQLASVSPPSPCFKNHHSVSEESLISSKSISSCSSNKGIKWRTELYLPGSH